MQIGGVAGEMALDVGTAGLAASESHAGHLARTDEQGCIDEYQESALQTMRAVNSPDRESGALLR